MDCSSDDSEEFLNHSASLDGSVVGRTAESSSPKLKRKGSLPKDPLLLAITRALLRLVKNKRSEVKETSVKNKVKEQNFFCVEDILLSKEIKVSVEDMGQLSFPLDKKSVEQMIMLSSKAKFGKDKDTILHTTIRDTQTIPASRLQVEIENSSLDDLLQRIGAGLNFDCDNRLNPNLHNLLIYGPGQFFKKHSDSEKIENMNATLVVILPSVHQGGELIIEHNNKKHMVLGSKHPDIIKCVAFYSDCAHEIKEVTDGYRVALTYNVALQPPDVQDCTSVDYNVALQPPDIQVCTSVDNRLYTAVKTFFDNGKVKLVCGLNHCYSEKTLKWDLMKGEDRVVANALLSVAKKQGRVACLALGKFYEIYDVEDKYAYEEPDLIEEEKYLKFWIDENNLPFKSDQFHDTYIDNEEFCFTKKTKDLCLPYKTKASGPTDNEGMTEELWYRRSCVVLWSSKWVLVQRFKQELNELHGLTKQNGMEKVLSERIDGIGEEFIQKEVWQEPSVADLLLDIITYLNDVKKAIMVLKRLGEHLLQENKIDRLVMLERQFGDEVWTRVVEYWKLSSGWHRVVSMAHTFIDKYISYTGKFCKSIIIDNILENAVDGLTKWREHKLSYVYGRIEQRVIDEMFKMIEICSEMGQHYYVNTLINFVTSFFPAVSQGELYYKLKNMFKSEHFQIYSTLKDSAEKTIQKRLLELKENEDWTIDKKYNCNCKKCKQIKEFFESKSMTKLVVHATKSLKEHIQEVTSHYENYDYDDYYGRYRIAFKRNGRKFEITFEKLPKFQLDRQILKDDLTRYLEEVQNHEEAENKTLTFVQVKVEEDHEENVAEIPITLETSAYVKKEKLLEQDLKFETDSATSDDIDLYDEIPKKRIKQ